MENDLLFTYAPALAGIGSGLIAALLQTIPNEFKKKSSGSWKQIAGFALAGSILGWTLPLMPGQILWNSIFVILLALIMAISWEDIRNQIAPDILTIGGGCLLLALMLVLSSTNSIPVIPLKHVLLGTLAGAGTLAAVSFFGKAIFGKKTLKFDEPHNFTIDKSAKTLEIDGESYELGIFFQEGSGKVEILSPENETLAVILNPEGDTIPEIPPTDKACNQVLIPRDVLGYGDIKYMFGIGAVLGPKGALFTIFCGCFLGAIGGIPLSKDGRIPLAPFLGAGALIYIWKGKEILQIMGWN